MKKNLITLSLVLVGLPTITFGQKYATGALFDDDAYRKLPLHVNPSGFSDDLPEAYSLRQYVPEVRSQGDYGTCTGWASTYYAATMEYAILTGTTNREDITAHAFDPYYTYLKSTSSDDYFRCQSGLYTGYACQGVVDFGAKLFGYNELTCGGRIDFSNSEDNCIVDFKSVTRIFDKESNTDAENLNNIKQALYENHPVIFGMNVPQCMDYPNEEGLLVCGESENLNGGHAVTVVAYDDDKFGGCFTIVNSWGKNYGDNGYIYIKYDDYLKYTKYAFKYETALKTLSSGNCKFGDCSNGYGRYTYESGYTYEGDFVDGYRVGYGVLSWPTSEFYGGEWLDGIRHGYGSYGADGSLWQGYWKDDVWVGDSVVVNDVISSRKKGSGDDLVIPATVMDLHEAMEDDNFITQIANSGKSGCLWGDCTDGIGLYVSDGFSVHLGTFTDGYYYGYGETFYLGDYRGHVYKGKYFGGYRDGFGSYYFPDGEVFHGFWWLDSKDGFGTYVYADGSTLTGTWSAGVYQSGDSGFAELDLQEGVDKIETKAATFESLKVDDALINATPSKKKDKKKKKG